MAEDDDMAIRGPNARRSKSTRPTIAIVLAVLACVLFFLMADGQIYRLTNGSSIGLIMTMAAIWVAGAASFAAFWVAVDPLRRRSRKRSATIHSVSVRGRRRDDEKAA